MKEITRKILSELANASNARVVRLPFAADLYPDESLRAAADAFTGLCQVEKETSPGQGAVLAISLASTVGVDGHRIIGELFNYLLMHAAQERFRSGQ
jgi:hypothetical protein